ncbi:MAG TPA: NAD(P)/FAD-dependent oxidoreductase [Nitrospirales bacterium]|nr:NAD(P)/FAD-dependent oxidoreductase [Nitrospiraceae bacterium]HNP30292.1 NAD(P)/FAD-dependent oxidoreductase [Nitrospirales bacterium]
MKTIFFDLVVIGTGSAASTVASQCRSAGWKVAIIDSRPFGGTCALRGCDPKKVLVGAAEVLDWSARMRGNGFLVENARIQWSELMRFTRSFTEPVPSNREERFSKAGIDTFHGRARFTGPNTVEIGSDVLQGHKIVIATGAMPVELSIPGAEAITTSEQFLELTDLPPNIIFIGGGYISFEFAHVAVRAGAQVSILHRGQRPLSGFDQDLVALLMEFTRELGIDVHLATEVQEIQDNGEGITVMASPKQGKNIKIRTKIVVHGAGRVPEIGDLALEAANIHYDKKQGVLVNDYFQSISNPNIYAAGDATLNAGGLPLTPVASYEGEIVASNLLNGNNRQPDYLGVPSVVFTIPPLASVGLSEQRAREEGLKFRTNFERTSSWYSSRRVGETCSGFKVLLEEGTDRVLGAHLIGHHSEELINLFALAIRSQLPAGHLRELLYAYPSRASDIWYMV